MSILELIAYTSMSFGVAILVISTIGLYRYKYVLNRMHIAAQSDTLGMFLIVVGVCILLGFTFNTLKLIAILAFFWLTSPVSSHIVAKMEMGSLEEDDEDKFRIEDRENE